MESITVYVWCPSLPGVHGHVMQVIKSPVLVVQKPPVVNKWFDMVSDEYVVGLQTQALTLVIKEWRTGKGKSFYLAFYHDDTIPEGAIQPGVPTVQQVLDLWPDLLSTVCEPVFCLVCEGHRYCFRNYDMMTYTCTHCKQTMSEQSLDQYLYLQSNPKIKPKSDHASDSAMDLNTSIKAAYQSMMKEQLKQESWLKAHSQIEEAERQGRQNYEKRAASEFEGVSGLDESLWKDEGDDLI